MMKSIFFIISFILIKTFGQVVRYDNYQVFRVYPKTLQHIDDLNYLHINRTDLDFWKHPSRLNTAVDIMVPPNLLEFMHDFCKNFSLQTEIIIENVQSLMNDNKILDKRDTSFNWNQYHRVNKINDWLRSLPEKYPNWITLLNIGKTYEGRDIIGVKISFNPDKKAVFLEGGIHAREWISPATVTFILNELLTNENPNVRSVIENFDWYIFPVVNPDGYEYTYLYDRTWRKNRNPNRICYGTDLNRNWNYHWMDGGASSDPCSEIYAGSSPFSELETKALSTFLSDISNYLDIYISFHSYSQFLLLPFGYTNQHLGNFNDLYTIGKRAAEVISRKYGTDYKVGNVVDIIYVASGSSMDWAKGFLGIPFTYTFELRDTGRYGFILPANQIIPCGKETFDGIVTIVNETKRITDK